MTYIKLQDKARSMSQEQLVLSALSNIFEIVKSDRKHFYDEEQAVLGEIERRLEFINEKN